MTGKIMKKLFIPVLLLILPACSHFSDKAFEPQPVSPNLAPQPVYIPTQGSYGDYGNPKGLRYYKRVLSEEKWRETVVLNYTTGFFAFPPLCGSKVLHYDDYQEQTSVHLYRDVISGEKFDDVIARKLGCDHCRLIRSNLRGMDDLELVEADADCYIWLLGDYAGKYYFLRAGNIVYTFSMFTPPASFNQHSEDFERFVKITIKDYLVYTPRNNQVPSPSSVPSAHERLSPYFTRKELISFFAPNQNLTFK